LTIPLTKSDASDRRARFEAIATPLMGVLYNAALRWTRQPAEASDLVQETYLRAYRTFDSFAAGTNAKAWLLTIAYSIFVNRYRKQQREPHAVSIDDLGEWHEAFAAPSSERPDAQYGKERMAAEIEQALETLPELFRSAVRLVDVDELSYEEAATALGCPVGTLRSRLHRARKLLLTALTGYARRAGYLKGGTGNE
jgi:RNA polymerase sigma-70 factor (ECF subfamily)